MKEEEGPSSPQTLQRIAGEGRWQSQDLGQRPCLTLPQIINGLLTLWSLVSAAFKRVGVIISIERGG